jgi:FCP1-like phosphatase family protein
MAQQMADQAALFSVPPWVSSVEPSIGIGAVRRGEVIATCVEAGSATADPVASTIQAPDDGILLRWFLGPGGVPASEGCIAAFATCSHRMLLNGLCAVCHADMHQHDVTKAFHDRPSLSADGRLGSRVTRALRQWPKATQADQAASEVAVDPELEAKLVPGGGLPLWPIHTNVSQGQAAPKTYTSSAHESRSHGKSPLENGRYLTVNAVSGYRLQVANHEASRFDLVAQQRLLRSQKLALVLDIDHTLLHATCEPRAAMIAEACGIDAFVGGDVTYFIKLRPAVRTFLSLCSSLCELSIDTAGTRPYAEKVATLLDPTRSLFGRRIVSRNDHDFLSTGRKSAVWLHRAVQDSAMVLVLDDTATAWDQTAPRSLIQIDPYIFYGAFDDVNNAAGASATGAPRAQPELEHDELSVDDAYLEMISVLGASAASSSSSSSSSSSPLSLSSLSSSSVVATSDSSTPATVATEAPSMSVSGASVLAEGVAATTTASIASSSVSTKPVDHDTLPPPPIGRKRRRISLSEIPIESRPSAAASLASEWLGSVDEPPAPVSAIEPSPAKRYKRIEPPQGMATRIMRTMREEQLPILADAFAVILWTHHAFYGLPPPPHPAETARLFLQRAAETNEWPGLAHDLCAPAEMKRGERDSEPVSPLSPSKRLLATPRGGDWRGRVAALIASQSSHFECSPVVSRGTSPFDLAVRTEAGEGQRPGTTLEETIQTHSAEISTAPHDARVCLGSRITWPLAGTCLLLSGVFPRGAMVEREPMVVRARQMGATFVEDYSDRCTHVLSARGITEKVQQALDANVKSWERGETTLQSTVTAVVHVEWLQESIRRFRRMPEQLFPLASVPAHSVPPALPEARTRLVYPAPVLPLEIPDAPQAENSVADLMRDLGAARDAGGGEAASLASSVFGSSDEDEDDAQQLHPAMATSTEQCALDRVLARQLEASKQRRLDERESDSGGDGFDDDDDMFNEVDGYE